MEDHQYSEQEENRQVDRAIGFWMGMFCGMLSTAFVISLILLISKVW